MSKILIIDDDAALASLAENLYYRGYDVSRLTSVAQAMPLIDNILLHDLIILDILMEMPSSFPFKESPSTHGGMALYREIRTRNPKIPVLIYTASQDLDIIEIMNSDKYARFLRKYSTPSMADIASTISSMLGLKPTKLPPTIFIVHGHNDHAKLELKNYLQNTLKLPEPIILHERPNLGRTLIKKFEDYAYSSNLVFVLLTPDDLPASPKDSNDAKRRARQNVILELGFFLGNLGRESGRVILLHEGPIELPTDLAGVVYIDISSGILAASEEIRKEISHVIK